MGGRGVWWGHGREVGGWGHEREGMWWQCDGGHREVVSTPAITV